MGDRKTRRAVVLAKVETTYNEDAVPTPLADAVLVSEPDYSVDPNILTRNFTRNDLSPLGHKVGRKLARLAFGVELRSNGLTHSGDAGDAAKIGRLIRACGYAEAGMTGAGTVGTINAGINNTVNPTWVAGGANALKAPMLVTLTCVKGGASATAELRATGYQPDYDDAVLYSEEFSASTNSADGTITVDASDPLSVDYVAAGTWLEGEVVTLIVGGRKTTAVAPTTPTPTTVGDAIETAIAALHADIAASNTTGTVTVTFSNDMDGTAVTSGSTAMALGNTGGTATPTWTGNLTLGDTWYVWVFPVGVKYSPVSDNFESLTLYAYFDGMLHKVTGARGTFSIEAQAGGYGTINFEFTGQYVAPVDAAMPVNSVFETTQPPVIELARLNVNHWPAIVDVFSFTQNNEINYRPDQNSPDGYRGVNLTGRNPQGGIDPEAELVADFDFWSQLSTAQEMLFQMRAGQTDGNVIWMVAPEVQYTGLTYQDRTGTRVLDAGLQFTRQFGNDEFLMVFA